MNVIAVDDERLLLDDFVIQLDNMEEIKKVKGFTNGLEALDYAKENMIDVAFLDINMREIDGITLGKKLKLIQPQINIIFMTAYSEYVMEAMKIHASGYLMKPPIEEEIRNELHDLRKPVKNIDDKLIHIQCFGNFEVYINNKPCEFKYSKTKELFAYLVDRRGAYCSNGELIGILWEESEKSLSISSQLRNLVSDLRSTFKKAGCEEVIRKKRGVLGIAIEYIDCDYYRWVEGDVNAINAYNGEYMSQYSWAEFTHASM
ncbi:response regulator [uncultured Clostridium sp.]|uniref:response regulator n=1 Tax=uncultured Clostridium sp. TaxID=59620 RepID=UPI0025D1BDC2|nr:response regulator [uncultured Clostridium sp.]